MAVGVMYAEDAESVQEKGSKDEDVAALKAFDGVEKIMGVAEGMSGSIGDLAKGMGHAVEEKK